MQRLDTRVTEAELDAIRARAARVGLSVSSFVRMMALYGHCPNDVPTSEAAARERGSSE